MPDFSDPSKITPSTEGLQIRFNGKAFFEALIRSTHDVVSAMTGVFSVSANTIVTWTKTVEFSTTKEKEAYVLLTKSIMRALREQLQQELGQVYLDEQEHLVHKNRRMQFTAFELLGAGAYTLELRHFQQPETMRLVTDFLQAYRPWLRESFGMSNLRAEGVAGLYSAYFGNAFFEEFSAGDYPSLQGWLNDPLLKEHLQFQRRQRYRATLREYYYAPSLGQQDVALANVYQDPGFRVLDKLLSQEQREALGKLAGNNSNNHFLKTEYPHSIHDYFRHHFLAAKRSKYLNCAQEESRLLVLLGQPGHGKSSFCYRTAHDLLTSTSYAGTVHLIRLRETTRELWQHPFQEFARLLRPTKIDPITSWEDESTPSLLLLDGLDELCMAQGLSDHEIKELLRLCRQLTQDYPQLYIVITSRFNYLPSDQMRQSKALILSLDTLTPTQQQDLITKYAKLKDEKPRTDADFLATINEEDGTYKHLRELIELPILLQIILLSGTDLQASDSRATIYDELFDRVLQRKWDEGGRLQKYVDENDFQPEDLRHYLAFLALKIYQAPEAYLNRTQISSFSETREFIREFLTLKNEKEAGIDTVLKDVLTSFYLQEKRKQEDDTYPEESRQQYAIEFLHKSLFEYLACDHIWRQIKSFFLKPTGKPKYQAFKQVGENLQRLLAHTRLSTEMLDNLKEIIAQDTDCHVALQQAMTELLPDLLQHGGLYAYPLSDESIPQRYHPGQQGLHVVHSYLAILGNLRLHEAERITVLDQEWPELYQQYFADLTAEQVIKAYGLPPHIAEEASFTSHWEQLATPPAQTNELSATQAYLRGSLYRHQRQQLATQLAESTWDSLTIWLRALAAERLPLRFSLAAAQFPQQDLQGCYAPYISLMGANLVGADLVGAHLYKANLVGANLERANLERAILERANLERANLVGANLERANLERAILERAILERAILSSRDQLNHIDPDSQQDIFRRYYVTEETQKINFRGRIVEGYLVLPIEDKASEEEE